MSKADSIKERLALIRIEITAFSGLILVIFWSIYQNDSVVKNMPAIDKLTVMAVIIILIVALFYLYRDHNRNVNQLEKEP
jgi:hypothetical protein